MKIRQYAVILLIFAVVAGCSNRTEELEQRNAELQQQTEQMSQDLTSRDEYIEEVTKSINDIYGDIESERAKEKVVLREADEAEAGRGVTSADVRKRILNQIAAIDSTNSRNQKRLAELEKRVRSYRTQFAGLNEMVANLKKTLEERDQSITQLDSRVRELELDLTQKNQLVEEMDLTIAQQETLISRQTNQLTTGFYIVGTRKELEEKGIIDDQGGFLWGLLGSTTVLATDVSPDKFIPINKSSGATIEVSGKIDEIIPHREESLYRMSNDNKDHSTLIITEPEQFWRNNYLVVIMD